MDTAKSVANRITKAVITEFADANGINPGHLTDTPEELTAVEALAASRVLGPGVVFQ